MIQKNQTELNDAEFGNSCFFLTWLEEQWSKFTVIWKSPKLQPFNLISNYPKWHFTIILGSCTIRKMSLHQLISRIQSIFLCSARSYRRNDLLAEELPWTLSVWGTAWEELEIWEAPAQHLSICSSDLISEGVQAETKLIGVQTGPGKQLQLVPQSPLMWWLTGLEVPGNWGSQ